MPFISSETGLAVGLKYGSRANYVAADIRELIVSGILVPRESLRIDEVADFYQVSATPIREALHLLHAEGFIERSVGSGFRVYPFTQEDIEDVFLAHSFVAGELAARAVPKIDAATLSELRAVHFDTLALIERGRLPRLNEVNQVFHQTINRASNSPRLRWLTGFYLKYMPQRRYGNIRRWPEITVEGQTNLLAALENTDAAAARAAAAKNVNIAGQALARHFVESVRKQENRAIRPGAEDLRI